MLVQCTTTTGERIWLNSDKFISLQRGGSDNTTRILHEPANADGTQEHTDVKERPEIIASRVNGHDMGAENELARIAKLLEEAPIWGGR